MLKKIASSFRHVELDHLPYDSVERLNEHKRLMQEKPILQKVHKNFYDDFVPYIDGLREGVKIELGASGWSFLETLVPDLVKSDILPVSDINIQMDGLRLPFKDKSVSAFFLTNVLHHLSDVEVFFNEIDRVLMEEGVLFMIEPHCTPWSVFIWKYFHHEYYSKTDSWSFVSHGPVSSSNLALPWIVFTRDSAIFKRKFPNLNIVFRKSHTGFAYLLTGGLSYKSVLPLIFYPFVRIMDKVLSFFSSGCSDSFDTIILKKTGLVDGHGTSLHIKGEGKNNSEMCEPVTA